MTARALDAVRMEWERAASAPHARVVLRHLASVEPDLRRLGASDLHEVVEATSGRAGPIPADRVQAAIAGLVRQFACDELVGLTILRLLIPGLAAVGRSLRWGAGGPWAHREEFESDLVAAAWSSVRASAGCTLERPCQVILGRARRSLRTELERHRRDLARLGPRSVLDDAPAAGPDDLSELARGLSLLAGSLIPACDAALLIANRVHGYRLSELAALSGESAAHLAYRRRVAERAVCR